VNGKTVLVTGANTGIGLETAAGLAERGASVVITARDPAKGSAAVDEIRRRTPDASVEAMELDLSRLADVRRFAESYTQALDVLVNNAGLVLDHRAVTEDGFEMMFQVNHLGPFLLTNLLLPKLKARSPSRIVNVSSTAHRGAKLDFDDLQSVLNFSVRVYGTTKLCNILFTRELARRLQGTGVTANCLHPGTVRTGFGKDGDVRGVFALGLKLVRPFLLSPRSGAKTSIYLATSYDVEAVTGEYFVRSRRATPSAAARDDEAARRLWEVSEELVGLHQVA